MRELRTLDDRVNWLVEELLLVKEQMAALRQRLEALEHGQVLAGAEVSTHGVAPPGLPRATSDTCLPDETSWTHLGQAVLLPRLSAVSFMLVAALILRTVTDNGMLALMTGSLVGMTYAVGLIVAGVLLYGRQSPLAPVFPTCGALLLFAIIFESQGHFSSLSGQSGYLLLLLAETAIVLVGLHCRAKVLLFLAVFGSTVVGMAMAFPQPLFVPLALVVLVNAVAGHLAAGRGISSSLRWYALFLALFFWMLWAYKLNFALQFEPTQAAALGLPLFLPLLGVFWAFYSGASLRQALRGGEVPGIFHHLLPAVAAGGGFFAANAVLRPWLGRQVLVGLLTVLLSALYLGVVAWLARRKDGDVPGGKEFAAAATVLLVQGLAISVPALWALPIWTAAAAVLTLRADQWRSGGIRVISYCLQLFVLFHALQHHSLSARQTDWRAGLLVAAGMAAITLWLYRWCRRHPPRHYDSAFFTVFDENDRSAVLLLCLGLFQLFSAVSFALAAVVPVEGEGAARTFACLQSVVLNLGLVGLLGVGLRTRSRELLAVAGVVVLLAALKVFLFDLLRASGVPLVLSVFSFGVVAAASSVVLRRWQAGNG